MMLRTLGLAAVVTAALAMGAVAAPQGPPDPGDRRAPPGGEEGRPRRPQLFISPAGEPFRAPPGAPYPVAAWFAGADTDHDAALSRDEFVADALRFFAVLDTDHNGIIDGFEVSTYEQRIAPEIIGGAPPESLRGGPRGLGQDGGGEDRPRRPQGTNVLQGAALFGLIAEPEPVMAADGDFDRRITNAETAKAAKTRFAMLDLNKDGRLTLEELPRTPAQGALDGDQGRGGRRGGRPV